jgi:hypothetical protein
MNIIFGDNIAESAKVKYTVLELDTFVIDGEKTATAYAIVEQIPLHELSVLSQFKELHSGLMSEYRKRNWKYCEDALELLKGRWNKDLDTFYDDLFERVQTLKTQSLPDDWTGSMVKSS